MTRRSRDFLVTKRQEAIVFLKRQAILAYNDGDIATVRHLSGVALDKVVKDGTVGLKLEDFLWAFVLMSFFGGNWESFLLIEQAYEKFKIEEKVNSQPCIVLLNFIFDIFKFNGAQLEEHYPELIEIDITKLPDYRENYIDFLLTTIIEILWDRSHNSNKWETLCIKWSFHKTVKFLYSRLKVQKFLLYNSRLEGTEDLINEEFPVKDNPLSYFLAKSWFYIFTEKWTDLDNLIFEMKKYISFESEYALSFQCLLNSKRTPKENLTPMLYPAPHNEICNDYLKNIPEILRCQRIQMTRPRAIFYSRLETYFDTELAELKKEPYGKGHIRNNLLSINTLLKLEALRLWDLKMYQKAKKQRKDLLLEIGLYRSQRGKYTGEYTELINAIILFTTEIMDEKINEFDEIRKAYYLLVHSQS